MRRWTSARDDRYVVLALLAAAATAFAVLLVCLLAATGGRLVYSLDDPYIHLTLAHRIAEGSYGINPGEPASPSSSVLWPALLGVVALFSTAEWWPLVLNGACLLVTAGVLHRTLRRSLGPWAAAGVALALLLLLNVVGVAFTGMEHSWQVLVAVAVTAGVLAVVAEPERVPPWLVLAVVVGPLVRYELAGISAAAAVVLFCTGHRRVAVAATCGWLVLLGAFSFFLVHLSLDPLPSSVLVKSGVDGAPYATVVVEHVRRALSQPGFLVCLVVTGADAVLRRRWTLLHTYVAVALAAHAVAGDFGWFGRYEVYLYVALAPVLAGFASAWWRTGSPVPRALLATTCLAAVVAAEPLALRTVQTPLAARDIWSQQAQTAAFVREEWRRPVAVNDLGLVALRGGQPVLDLWGLASQDARVARLESGDPDWMDRSVRAHGIRLVAIYTAWFADDVPDSWTLAGQITGVSPVVSAERSVDLYVPDPADAPEVCAELRDFAGRSESEATRFTCGPGLAGGRVVGGG